MEIFLCVIPPRNSVSWSFVFEESNAAVYAVLDSMVVFVEVSRPQCAALKKIFDLILLV